MIQPKMGVKYTKVLFAPSNHRKEGFSSSYNLYEDSSVKWDYMSKEPIEMFVK